MTKRIAAKYKISRRIGESLWGRAKDPVGKRSYAPGQHGATRRRKASDFGNQLMAKQKLKGYYGSITERQFRRIYQEAARRKGDTSENLIALLESRLDTVVYRMGLVPTVFAARQFVSHGHIKVNGKRVNIASYGVQEGDEIEVKEKSRTISMIVEAQQNPIHVNSCNVRRDTCHASLLPRAPLHIPRLIIKWSEWIDFSEETFLRLWR
jgi:small subunit ribosomal protein S4